jgi:hypothetical protein
MKPFCFKGSPGTTQYEGQSSMEGTDRRCPKIQLTISRIQFTYLQSLICELITLEATALDFPVIKPVTLNRK